MSKPLEKPVRNKMTEQVDQRSGLPDSYVTQELVDYELGCLRQIFAQHRQLVDNAEDPRATYSIYSVILLEQQREWIDEATKGTIEEVAYAVAGDSSWPYGS